MIKAKSNWSLMGIPWGFYLASMFYEIPIKNRYSRRPPSWTTPAAPASHCVLWNGRRGHTSTDQRIHHPWTPTSDPAPRGRCHTSPHPRETASNAQRDTFASNFSGTAQASCRQHAGNTVQILESHLKTRTLRTTRLTCAGEWKMCWSFGSLLPMDRQLWAPEPWHYSSHLGVGLGNQRRRKEELRWAALQLQVLLLFHPDSLRYHRRLLLSRLPVLSMSFFFYPPARYAFDTVFPEISQGSFSELFHALTSGSSALFEERSELSGLSGRSSTRS